MSLLSDSASNPGPSSSASSTPATSSTPAPAQPGSAHQAPAHPAVAALAAVLNAATAAGQRLEEVAVESLTVHRQGTEDGYLVSLHGSAPYLVDAHGRVRQCEIGSAPYPDTDLRLDFVQAGGLSGYRSEYHAEDSDLTEADLHEVLRLVRQADFYHLPDVVDPGQETYDGFAYIITISRGRHHKTVQAQDGSGLDGLPGLRELVRWFRAKAPEPGPLAPVP